jgi:hypothetical protein
VLFPNQFYTTRKQHNLKSAKESEAEYASVEEMELDEDELVDLHYNTMINAP